MAEVRAHGLVAELVRTLLGYAPVYLVAGALSAWIARGLSRLARREKTEPGWVDGASGCGVFLALFGGVTVWGVLERPALFAGILYDRGGVRRAAQLALEGRLTPGAVAQTLGLLAGLAVAGAALGWWRHAPAGRRRVAAGTVALTVVALAAAAGARFFRPPQDPSRPNLLVVLVDSMRPEDVIPAEGPPAAPHVAAFAARGAWFADARTPCGLTYPSVASFMTGRHPVVHGVRTIYPDGPSRTLPMPTLPRLLGAAGWETAAVSGYCGTVFRELDLGFGRHLTPRGEAELIVSAAALRGHPWLPVVLRTTWARTVWPSMRSAVEGSHPNDVARDAMAAWRAIRGPFFVTVFFDNAHLPYVPVWPESAASGTYSGPNRYAVAAGDLVEQVREGEAATLARGHREEADHVRGLHRGAIASVDRAIGILLDALERDGLADNTIVAVLADHGENLLADGGPLAHGEAAERDRSTSIPWAIAWPGRIAPQTVAEPVTVLDALPTLTDLLGLPPPEVSDGVSLVTRLFEGTPVPERSMLFETGMWFFARDAVERLDPAGGALSYPDFTEGLLDLEAGEPPHIVIAPEYRGIVNRAKHRRLERGPWALTYVPREGPPRWRLFRRDVDPGLTRDLAAQEPDKLRAMIELFDAEAARLGDRDLLEMRSSDPAVADREQ